MILLMLILFCCPLALFLIKAGKSVPQHQAWIIERFGKFHRKPRPGLNWILPFIDSIAYIHSLKEEAIEVQKQTAITEDNVTVTLDGILYVRIIDPIAASYGVKNPHYAITQLVQTKMRSEIGKLSLDRTFEERESLNANIVATINEASSAWGIQCLRYEIKDINIPSDIQKAMELQMTAERQKRARILESEGQRQAEINIAEGVKQRIVLESEAACIHKINHAKGEAEGLYLLAEANLSTIQKLSQLLELSGAEEACRFKIAEQYLEAFKDLAKEGTSMIIPANITDLHSMVSQALFAFQHTTNLRK